MSTALALCLPEIVSHILKYLGNSTSEVDLENVDALNSVERESLPRDWEACMTEVFKEKRKTIRNCVLVNYVFFSEATSMLWAVFPPLSALLTLKPHRRSFYAGKIRSLCLFDDWKTLPGDLLHGSAPFPDAAFTKLRVLKVSGHLCDPVYASRLLPFLAPRLAQLDIYCGEAMVKELHQVDSFFRLLSARCPELRAIRVNDLYCRPTDGLLASINRISSVTAFALKSSELYKEDFMRNHLAPNFQLCKISMASHRFHSLLPAVETDPSSLKYIRKLTIDASATMITRHRQMLKHIEVLKLRLCEFNETLSAEQHAAGNLLVLLAECKGLRDLEINYRRLTYMDGAERYPVTGDDLIVLAKGCQRLQRLKLDCGYDHPSTFELRCGNITDQCLAFVASRLPELEVFELYYWDDWVSTLLTVDTLRSFGEHCSKLRVLKLFGNFDYSALDPDAPCLFPHLHSFGVLFHEQYRKHKPFFERHFPQLQEAGIDTGNLVPIE